MFRTNEAGWDRALRAALGLGLLGLAFGTLQGIWTVIAAAVGAIVLVTAILGFCPAYLLFGIDTCSVRR